MLGPHQRLSSGFAVVPESELSGSSSSLVVFGLVSACRRGCALDL